MKKIHYILSVAVMATVGLSSCNDYLDVRPKSQVLADEYFTDDQAYKDFLVGAYEKMTSEALYGRNLTFGLVEVLSQDYDLSTSNPYYEASNYNYTESSTRAMIDAIWSEQYNTIANLNLLLQYIDKTDRTAFEYSTHTTLY
ncbi:MAG: RagB/SusD family nutrient uptake outer membrane protein [Bacteroidaceae bacterium]|nr:RagB/SusD family nutrient uptake outer membrane protein [Bacteroidaceae bacterium]